jgi:hypothetical protein
MVSRRGTAVLHLKPISFNRSTRSAVMSLFLALEIGIFETLITDPVGYSGSLMYWVLYNDHSHGKAQLFRHDVHCARCGLLAKETTTTLETDRSGNARISPSSKTKDKQSSKAYDTYLKTECLETSN